MPLETDKLKIEFRNVTYIYNEASPFAKKALDDVSLSINNGEFVGLIGHTGSGKSTLIQHMNALIKPTSGDVYIDGENININKTKLKAVRQKVGLVFQYPEHQLFEMTVFKDVSFGPGNLGLSQTNIDARVNDALQLCGIPESDYYKSPFELSGGQKRRVAIAGVLAMTPDVLILDEPTAGLDPRGRDDLLENLRQMHEKRGLTIILVTHSMEDAAKLCEKVIVMHQGKIALSGDTRHVFSQAAALTNIGLAPPALSALMHTLSEKGYAVPTNIFTTEEATSALFELLRGCAP